MEKIKKGEMQSPVKVIIKKVTPYTECDFTTVYAYATELKRVDGAKSKITEIKTKKSKDSEEEFSDPYAVFDQSFYLEAGHAGFSIFSRWAPSFSSSQVPLSPDPGLLPGFVASGYTIYSNSDA